MSNVEVRPIVPEEIPELYRLAWANESHIRPYLPGLMYHYDTPSNTTKRIAILGRTGLAAGIWLPLDDSDSGGREQLVGQILIQPSSITDEADILYWVDKNLNGRGIAKNAVRATLDRDDLPGTIINGIVHQRNQASISVLVANGFRSVRGKRSIKRDSIHFQRKLS